MLIEFTGRMMTRYARLAIAAVLLLGVGCGEPSRTASVIDAAPLDAGPLASCGSPSDPEKPCCPVSWQPPGRCNPQSASRSCWRACVAAGGDGGMYWRTQLACQSDGTIGAGLGLFPCTP